MTRIPPVRRLLMKAKALISKPENWCKSTYARDKNGGRVDLSDLNVAARCAMGALHWADQSPEIRFSSRGALAFDLLRESLPDSWRRVSGFNDAPSTPHSMVMRLFNQAIRRAKEQGI